jgi:uncharacterized protein YecT (DUF1311 family)
MHSFKRIFNFFLAISYTSISPSLSAKEMPPSNLTGTWNVVQVGVDKSDQPHWLYRPNDPRILNRTLTISENFTLFNDEKIKCEHPIWKQQKTSFGELIKKDYSRPLNAANDRTPKPGDFDLSYSNTLPVIKHTVQCSNNDPKGDWQNFWLAEVNSGTALLHFDSTVLMKITQQKSQPPSPSYQCKKAQTKTELAICRDHGLAGYDKSIYSALKIAREKNPELSDKLLEQQRIWLKERDNCQSDAPCLQDKMWHRLEELCQE